MSTTARRFTSYNYEVLEDSSVRTIDNALRVAAEQFRTDAEGARATATALRAGETFALIAPGEDGARAMDALAEQFQRQADESEGLRDGLSEAVNVVLNNDEDASF